VLGGSTQVARKAEKQALQVGGANKKAGLALLWSKLNQGGVVNLSGVVLVGLGRWG